jgi:hypothetical protein
MGWSFIDFSELPWYHKLWIYPAIVLYFIVAFAASIFAVVKESILWLCNKLNFGEDWCMLFHYRSWIGTGGNKLICPKCYRKYIAKVIDGQVCIDRRDV